jgi:hypothetical protein
MDKFSVWAAWEMMGPGLGAAGHLVGGFPGEVRRGQASTGERGGRGCRRDLVGQPWRKGPMQALLHPYMRLSEQ